MTTTKRYYVHPLIVLFIGVAFNVSSVAFMHIVARDVDREIQLLSNQEAVIDRHIDGLWSGVVRTENIVNTTLLLLQSNPELAFDYARKSGTFSREMLDDITPTSLFTVLKKQRSQQLDVIDDAFVEKLSKEQQRGELEARNDQLMNIGLFLHMLGIVVILSMDINRKHY